MSGSTNMDWKEGVNLFDASLLGHAKCASVVWKSLFKEDISKFHFNKLMTYANEKGIFPFVHPAMRHKGNYPEDIRMTLQKFEQAGYGLFTTDEEKNHPVMDVDRVFSMVNEIELAGKLEGFNTSDKILLYKEIIPKYKREWASNEQYLGYKSLGLGGFGQKDPISNQDNFLYHSDWKSHPDQPIMIGFGGAMAELPVGLIHNKLFGGRRKISSDIWTMIKNKGSLSIYQTVISELNCYQDKHIKREEIMNKPYLFWGHLENHLEYHEDKGVNVCTFNNLTQHDDKLSKIEMWCDPEGTYAVKLHEFRPYELIAFGRITLHGDVPIAKNYAFIKTRLMNC